jgi:hypothetical protein
MSKSAIHGNGKHTYRVELSGMARMKGYAEVQANDQAAAEKLAAQHAGDVIWSYQEMDDSTVEAYAIKKT